MTVMGVGIYLQPEALHFCGITGLSKCSGDVERLWRMHWQTALAGCIFVGVWGIFRRRGNLLSNVLSMFYSSWSKFDYSIFDMPSRAIVEMHG